MPSPITVGGGLLSIFNGELTFGGEVEILDAREVELEVWLKVKKSRELMIRGVELIRSKSHGRTDGRTRQKRPPP